MVIDERHRRIQLRGQPRREDWLLPRSLWAPKGTGKQVISIGDGGAGEDLVPGTGSPYQHRQSATIGHSMGPWLTVIGIGEDGVEGLSGDARRALAAAETIFGGTRHLALLSPEVKGERKPWPVPFGQAYEMVLAHRGRNVAILASGDPMFYGMGASISRFVAMEEMRILPAPSSFSLAAARVGWPMQDTILTSVHGRPVETLHLHLAPGARLLVLSNDGTTPAAIARMLTERGFGSSALAALEHLGGPDERRIDGVANSWAHARTADLNVVAIECRGGADAHPYSRIGGLPDSAFVHDGQLTKRDVRAITLTRLAPLPGELLWDVGAGCGSIGIEWMRAHPSCRAIAIEAHAGRRAYIERNCRALGVPDLKIVAGEAPAAFSGLDTPDAIFIGGGFGDAGVVDTCWRDLRPGGRLVANAVTVQNEALLVAWHERAGGELTRISVAHAEPLGGFDAWRTALPVTVFSAVKPR